MSDSLAEFGHSFVEAGAEFSKLFLGEIEFFLSGLGVFVFGVLPRFNRGMQLNPSLSEEGLRLLTDWLGRIGKLLGQLLIFLADFSQLDFLIRHAPQIAGKA